MNLTANELITLILQLEKLGHFDYADKLRELLAMRGAA
jgi:hypothetical protein